MAYPPNPPDPNQPPTWPHRVPPTRPQFPQQPPPPQGAPPPPYPPYIPPQPPPMHPEQQTFYRRSNRIMAWHEWRTLWWPLILGVLFFGLMLAFIAWNAIFG